MAPGADSSPSSVNRSGQQPKSAPMALKSGGAKSPALKAINTKRLISSSDELTEEEEEEPLSPGARVFHEPSMNCCVLAVLGIGTAIDVEVIKEGLKQTLIKHPRFSSKLVVKRGKKKWVRTEVNLEEHIIVPELQELKKLNRDDDDEEEEEEEDIVEEYVSRLTTVPLEFSNKPLWEIHLLKIKRSEAEGGIGIFRIHHSLGDGISLISLLLACTRKTSDPNTLPDLPNNYTKNTNKTPASVAVSWWRLVLMGMLFMSKLFWNTTIDMAHFLVTMLFLKDTNTPIKGPPGTQKNPRRIAHRIVSLDDIKLVKNEMKATVNDVMMGLVQAGISRYLNRKYGSDDVINNNNKKRANDHHHPRLRACLLVNVRPSSGIQELANMMEKGSNCRWGNAIGYIILPFRIVLRDDPLDYIRQAKATLDKKKQSLEAKLTYMSALFILKLFGEKVVAKLSHRVVAHTTMCFSNVAGPLDEVTFYGHPITYIAPTVYGHPQALTVHFQSHANKMTIVVGVDETVISSPHPILDDFEESLKQIKNVILTRSRT